MLFDACIAVRWCCDGDEALGKKEIKLAARGVGRRPLLSPGYLPVCLSNLHAVACRLRDALGETLFALNSTTQQTPLAAVYKYRSTGEAGHSDWVPGALREWQIDWAKDLAQAPGPPQAPSGPPHLHESPNAAARHA